MQQLPKILIFHQFRNHSAQGDSGSPLAFNDGQELVGLASFGSTLCGSGRPDASNRVSQFASWITDTCGSGAHAGSHAGAHASAHASAHADSSADESSDSSADSSSDSSADESSDSSADTSDDESDDESAEENADVPAAAHAGNSAN